MDQQQTSKLIAGFLGPALAAMGPALILNDTLRTALLLELPHNLGLIFIAGLLALIAGIAIVRVHNHWSNDWTVIVTIFGWLAILGGLVRMWMPQLAIPIAERLATDPTIILVAASVMTALGAFLSYKAYR